MENLKAVAIKMCIAHNVPNLETAGVITLSFDFLFKIWDITTCFGVFSSFYIFRDVNHC